MIKSNFHQHSLFSDGKKPLEDYIQQALQLGFTAMGFSEHSPLPFETYYSLESNREEEYVMETNRLKQKYHDQIDLYRALEQDYIPSITEDFASVAKRLELNYSIGSVHLVSPAAGEELWFIDGPNQDIYDVGLTQFFGADIKQAVKAYYHQLNQMIDSQQMDVVGHLDKIKMHNADRFFKEEEMWYQKLVNETLDLIKSKNLIVEVNTRGIYKKRSAHYFPDNACLRKIKQLNIPVIISSDAHEPHELNLGFEAAREHLLLFGFDAVRYFNGQNWEEQSLR